MNNIFVLFRPYPNETSCFNTRGLLFVLHLILQVPTRALAVKRLLKDDTGAVKYSREKSSRMPRNVYLKEFSPS